MDDEEEIIEELKNGNKERFEYLYSKYEKAVYDCILKYVGSRDKTEELVQDTFIKLFRSIKFYDSSKGTFFNFVSAIARYTAIDYLRKKNNMEKVVDNNITFDDNIINLLKMDCNVLDTVEKNEFMKNMKKLINELCDSQRMAIILVCERGFSYKYSAKIMGITEGSFKSILYRARKTLKDKICKKYPEYVEDISSRKYVARIIVMIIVGMTAITGLVYATYMICSGIFDKKTFTLSEMRTEISAEESIISKEEALDKINYYLDVLGEEKVEIDDLKLIKDYLFYKICWNVEREDMMIKIDSTNGELVKYINYNEDGILIGENFEELNNKIGIPKDYQLYEAADYENTKTIRYARKYGEIYNQYECISYYGNNRIESINVWNYSYKDTEIIVSKEEALKIAKENNINVDKIELSIERTFDFKLNNRDKSSEVLDEYTKEDWKLFYFNTKIRKVWKILNGNETILIDVKDGEVIYDF